MHSTTPSNSMPLCLDAFGLISASEDFSFAGFSAHSFLLPYMTAVLASGDG
jgi:hypothetical protein